MTIQCELLKLRLQQQREEARLARRRLQTTSSTASTSASASAFPFAFAAPPPPPPTSSAESNRSPQTPGTTHRPLMSLANDNNNNNNNKERNRSLQLDVEFTPKQVRLDCCVWREQLDWRASKRQQMIMTTIKPANSRQQQQQQRRRREASGSSDTFASARPIRRRVVAFALALAAVGGDETRRLAVSRRGGRRRQLRVVSLSLLLSWPASSWAPQFLSICCSTGGPNSTLECNYAVDGRRRRRRRQQMQSSESLLSQTSTEREELSVLIGRRRRRRRQKRRAEQEEVVYALADGPKVLSSSSSSCNTRCSVALAGPNADNYLAKKMTIRTDNHKETSEHSEPSATPKPQQQQQQQKPLDNPPPPRINRTRTERRRNARINNNYNELDELVVNRNVCRRTDDQQRHRPDDYHDDHEDRQHQHQHQHQHRQQQQIERTPLSELLYYGRRSGGGGGGGGGRREPANNRSLPALFACLACTLITLALSCNPVVEAVDCFKCSSRNGSNPACEDPFHNLNTTRVSSPVLPDPAPSVIYHTPCYAGKKGREGLFPASACIKLTGTFDATGEALVVRHCALDSGTLTQDTELARMSHCGKFQFEGDLLKGCVLACPEDACNSGPPSAGPLLDWPRLAAMAISLALSLTLI